jgi:rRNA biogenesis protein RRP5
MQHLRVHHKGDGTLLLQLDGGGFGRLTKQGLGDDALAARMMTHLSTQDTVPVTAILPSRASDGFAHVTVALADACSDVVTIRNATVRQLLSVLFRKNVVCGLGRQVMGRVMVAKEAGTVLKLANGLSAVALGAAPKDEDALDGDDDQTASVVGTRVLYYETGAGVCSCSMETDVVSRAAESDEEVADYAASLRVGAVVQCRVLLQVREDAPLNNVLVMEIEDGNSAGKTCLVYAQQPAEKGKTATLLNTVVTCRLAFVPNASMAVVTPFAVATVVSTEGRGPAASGMPLVRQAPATSSLAVPFPWRCQSSTNHRDDPSSKADEPKTRRRKLEEELDRFERQGEKAPSSPDEFEKMLLANPNSSYVWTQYMAFLINLQQIEGARAVAEKALRQMSVSNNDDRVNMWVAYMNLENIHGTAESLTSVFKRACLHCDDQLSIHERLADILSATKKKEQLVQLCRSMATKYRHYPRVWERLGKALIDGGKRDQQKRIMQDMARSLNKNEQALVLVHLAIHEYKLGSVEQGRSIFEGLVANFPKKSDVWSAYLDQEVGALQRKEAHASLQGSRTIFERASTTSFPPKVMQAFLTRFLTFEQNFGTEADVDKVKTKARTYVESRISSSGL